PEACALHHVCHVQGNWRLISQSIEAALDSGVFDEVIVSTDDEEIAAVAETFGATVPFMRPSKIADDFAPILDVMVDAAQWYGRQQKPLSHMCLIYATAPFVRAKDIQAGLNALQNSDAPSAMSVAKFPYPIQRAMEIGADGRLDMIQKEHLLTRSQDLAETYMDAAQFIWTTPGAMSRCKTSLLELGMLPVVLSVERVQDIDTPEDWARAEALYQITAEGS
ncbi:MAG: pseudaminic acid cytidylyltransferase, partial [Kordiimonadaceae bacterium]|nr:pseudaminic acid cytidylyltransferase [Kordiimonadaceae bacterium]